MDMPFHRCGSCSRLVQGRCPHCRQARERAKPSPSSQGYNSARWRKLRLYKLSIDSLCSVCLAAGRMTAATDVDHLQPHDGPNDPLMWAWSNLDAKCHACHSRKTATVDSGFARRR
jgi:5-methylcytosine-specific restriction protein A